MDTMRVAEVFPPGEFILEELEARGWSQTELADILSFARNIVNELISGKRTITPKIAKALAEAFGSSAQYWMNLDSAYQLWKIKSGDAEISRRARLYELAPVKELVRRNWIEPSNSIDVLENRIANFFEVPDLDTPIQLFRHAARKSTIEMSTAERSWLFRARHLARSVHVKPFTEQAFKTGLAKLKDLLLSSQEVRQVPKILAEAGVRFLVIEHMPHTKIDGVAFWLDSKSPVIALSMRFDRVDWFWHTLAHELGHIEKRHTFAFDSNLLSEETSSEGDKSQEEKEADLFAATFLVDQTELRNFMLRVKPLYSRQKIVGFANRIKVHPGIIVGQLQFRKEVPWSSFRPLLDKVRNIVIQSALTDGWGQILPALNS